MPAQHQAGENLPDTRPWDPEAEAWEEHRPWGEVIWPLPHVTELGDFGQVSVPHWVLFSHL